MYSAGAASYYDAIYSSQGKDYGKESEYLCGVVQTRITEKKASLLDVACGTGNHLVHLKKSFDVEGVDVSLDFVKIARAKMPKVRFYVGDMKTFRTGREYTVVTCLFSSVGYMATLDHLHSAIRNMARHVKAGGLLVVEPWYSPGQLVNGRVFLTVVEQERATVVRMSTTKVEGNVSSFDFHYLVGTQKGTEHLLEKHRMGLFTKDEMADALEKSGLSVEYDEKGPSGRGLYIGRKSQGLPLRVGA